MNDLVYKCPPCSTVFTGVETLAEHVWKEHQPHKLEDELDRAHRQIPELPNDDDDEDDDEAEDDLLPTRLPAVARRLTYLRARASVAIAERNTAGLEALVVELGNVETHWLICSEQLKRSSDAASCTRQLVEWVLQEGCEVTR